MNKPLRVLIVDDSEDDTLLLVRKLKRDGFNPTFERVDTPEAMEDALSKNTWDIILSDYNIPRFDAFAALDMLKKSGIDIPFIIVSGAIGEETAVAAMKAGAHDYVMKDNLARLVAAIERELGEAQIRHKKKETEKQLEHSFFDLAETVARAMDSRDPYTAGHARKVAEYARKIGEKMELDRDKINGLYVCGLLHDIGKISIPESILCKPGSLSEEEWALMRTHTIRGYEILKNCSLPWPVADVALHHHEQLDGSGYPDGLKDDELNLENRIIRVCDVVEAMSSHRPYRPAKSIAEVIDELKSGRGLKYDSNIIDVMLQLLEEG
ncbi:Response regulator receiver modulated metal dependent phosphohydrolase [Tepidanaerobacter acetatoxydans Re1]|uniref:Stage 0 sporulation protein A homolog n=1 Tax=Tepidanaerobacter acetatoxydans (strain DSM 21804 / JCM 16047 / Re1) TaxID=1209989 RepID=F4LUI9_TEPAE|nr:HD domain-containing phosphohydrolase [Tepidanaerobacter acetatoxydans]AEE92634.1 response regulator receiver modulated metal dependent phosphohydrolase [Tepidanaerobacter acetatoxydans Re1]CCP27606.1 Response regulator receiver modulated metal dependent phosphohydrolase [Tepidanaerobacter acetatoxydans Re1]